MSQRSETLICVTSIVHALALTLRIFFLFRYVVPARKNKEQLGSKVRPMYSLVPFLSQLCSARDAYCALSPSYFARHYSVLCNQRFFIKLPMTLYSMIVHEIFLFLPMDMLA